MNTLQIATGFKKEWWEFKTILVWVPTILAGLIILAPIIQLLLLEPYQFERIIYSLSQLDNVSQPAFFKQAVQSAISALFLPFMTISLLMQLYYFTSCLFDERRDLSIYFWRSLPVSDGVTVITKLLTGALVIPAVFMLAATAVLLITLLLLLIACLVLSANFDISLWGLWGNAGILTSIGAMWLNLLPYAIWLFPVYAWFMLASVFANKAPFLWAILPIAVLLLVESFIVAYFHLDSRFFGDGLRQYLALSIDMLPDELTSGAAEQPIIFSVLWEKISLVATLIGAGLIYLTYWVRVNKSPG